MHSHSQNIATPVVPEDLQNEVHHSREYQREYQHCVFCSLIDEALTYAATIYDRESGRIRRKINVGQYVIERDERFVAIKPSACRFAWEIHILPLQHRSGFLKASKADLAEFARVLQHAMARLDKVVGGVQCNFFLHSVPLGSEFDDCGASYHWHVEICPRTSIPTGFEPGSGLIVSTVNPEVAAEALRKADIDGT